MSDRDRRYSKRELLGNLHVDYVMSVTDLGLAARSNRWDVLRAFLAVGEARAERLVEENDGFLILQSVPGQPNTGGIYLFAEPLEAFFWLRFDHKEDTLNGDDFQLALRVYRLLDLINGERRKFHRPRGHRNRPRSSSHSDRGAGGMAPAGYREDPRFPAHLTEFRNRDTTAQLKEGSIRHGSGSIISVATATTGAGTFAGNSRPGGRIHGVVCEPPRLHAANRLAG